MLLQPFLLQFELYDIAYFTRVFNNINNINNNNNNI